MSEQVSPLRQLMTIAVSVFVVEINGVAVVAFNADNQFRAERIAAGPRLRSDLMVNHTAAGPIWNGVDQIIVRKAVYNEYSLWDGMRVLAAPQTSEETQVLEVWLVNVTNRTEEAARQRPLH